ncbi:MAG: hypothetical protein HN491_12275 [Rhodospirillales bacterium]|nr:hypothetical protein [Rhodospirillales bacterium]
MPRRLTLAAVAQIMAMTAPETTCEIQGGDPAITSGAHEPRATAAKMNWRLADRYPLLNLLTIYSVCQLDVVVGAIDGDAATSRPS